ncbi:hypothetical protein MA16_Dca022745 [Dendrobium catenatum]|uniref:Uncharacterized protein n=1 Tax=Dendrobium catenatum TaxID=906689 RepID=A0A2I0WJ68_9ASPA|nr:hypothetical protein MA16_Dca022745 [Dendrobium catenatum]
MKGVRVVQCKNGAEIEGLTPSHASGDPSSDSGGEELESELQQAFSLEEDEDDIDILRMNLRLKMFELNIFGSDGAQGRRTSSCCGKIAYNASLPDLRSNYNVGQGSGVTWRLSRILASGKTLASLERRTELQHRSEVWRISGIGQYSGGGREGVIPSYPSLLLLLFFSSSCLGPLS